MEKNVDIAVIRPMPETNKTLTSRSEEMILGWVSGLPNGADAQILFSTKQQTGSSNSLLSDLEAQRCYREAETNGGGFFV